MKKTFRNILITGGSSGIGLELARLLTMEGAHVAILARRKDLIRTALAELEEKRRTADQRIMGISADVSNWDQVDSALSSFIKENGAPDLLVNSAGITRPGNFRSLPINTFEQMVNVNYLGTVYTIRSVLDGMIARGEGTIVNISSMAGFLGVYGYSAYCASKYAVRGLSEVLRAELKPKGIRVAIVYPPDTLTAQLEGEQPFKPPITKELTKTAGVLTAEKVAQDILRDVRRGYFTICPGFESRFYYFLHHLLGDLTFNVMDMQIESAIQTIIQRRKR